MEMIKFDKNFSTDISEFTKACQTCHKPNTVSAFTSLKNCDNCRKKNRRKSELAQERKKLKKTQFAVWNARSAALLKNSDIEVDENNRDEPMPVVTSTGATKRKPTKALHELEGEEHRVALGLMKNGLKQVVKGNKRVVSPVTRVVTTIDAGKEYQSATAMYESLKKRVKKSPGDASAPNFLRFHGFHSIVAVSTIDNQKRVDMVARDLRKIVRVPFEHSNPNASYDFETMGRTISFRCSCLGHSPATVPVAVPTTAMKGTQGDLIRHARARASLDGIPRICGGTIKITAVDDGRHPLGILGQRISVSIEHPTGTSHAD